MPVANVTKRVRYFVSDFAAGTVSVIDEFTNNIIQTYDVGVNPQEVIADKDGSVYVANSGSSTVTIICLSGSTRTLMVPNNGNIDVDIVTGRLYASSGNIVSVYDIVSGALIYNITGLTTAGFVKLNNSRNRLLVADGNILKIFSTVTFDNVATIPLNGTISYITIDLTDSKAFVSFGTTPTAGIAVIDLKTNKFLTNILSAFITSPAGLEVNGNVLYAVNNETSGSVVTIDAINFTILGTPIAVGKNPVRLAVSPDGPFLYVTNFGDNTVSIVNIITHTSEALSLGSPSSPFGIAGLFNGSLISPGDPIDLSDPYQIDDIKESVCIITKKVFAHCQNRECFPMVTKEVPTGEGNLTFAGITFSNTIITSELRTPLPDRPNFSRVQLTLRIPYTIRYQTTKGAIITDTGFLPDISKDIVLFIPDSRDEFNFDILIESRSELLNTPTIMANCINFAVGVFLVIKVVGEVQLLVPAFGYCPEPPECEDYEEPEQEDLCKVFLDFTQTPFPDNFFPPQYEDVKCIT